MKPNVAQCSFLLHRTLFNNQFPINLKPDSRVFQGQVPPHLHGRAEAVVGEAADPGHVPGDVVDGGDHVPGRLCADGVAADVERDLGQRRPHGDAQHLHRAALADAARRVDRRRLELAGQGKELMYIMYVIIPHIPKFSKSKNQGKWKW